jgi:RimJ/RimL family protein N-acetyltransferase
VLRQSDRVLVGRCGVSDLAVEARPAATDVPRAWYHRASAPADIELLFECELGYTFDRSHWGHGYAGEAARCVFEYACRVRRLARVVSLIHPDNGRSLRVAQRFALRREDVVSLGGSPRVRYVWLSLPAD